MKKTLAVLIALLFIMNISGCKKSNNKTEKSEEGVNKVETTEYDTEYVKLRNGLANTYLKLKNDKKLTVAYVGGSITAGAGAAEPAKTSYRALTTSWLKTNYPDADIMEINMGIGSVGSLLPVFYLDDYVIANKPDLIFIETAVNDYLQQFTNEEISLYYESIIRKLLNANPYCEIVSLYTINDVLPVAEEYYTQAEVQNQLAEYYKIPSANIGRKLRREKGLIQPKLNGEYTTRWKQFFGDEVHPTNIGHKEYADTIAYLLESAFSLAESANAKTVKAELPKQKNKDLLLDTEFIPTTDFDVSNSKGWKHADYKAEEYRWGVSNYIYTETDDNELSFTFTGSNLYIVSSTVPWDDTAKLYEYSVDGGEWESMPSNGGDPKKIVTGLENGDHIVRLHIGGCGKNALSSEYKQFSLMAILVS